MSHRIALDQLSIRLRGVARPVAEEALAGLGEALALRLARTAPSTLPPADIFPRRLVAEDLPDPRDAAALRDAIAARIIAGLAEGRGRATVREGAP